MKKHPSSMYYNSVKRFSQHKTGSGHVRLALAAFGIIIAILTVYSPYTLQNLFHVQNNDQDCTLYAAMIDAGSAGSRIHVYRFQQCKPTDVIRLDDEILFTQTIPGLSSYADDPEAAAHSLDNLLDAAVEAVPASLRHRTPIAVKATAGLRLLGDEKSEAILRAVYQHLKSYPFLIPNGRKDVAIMDGIDEGVYAWITVNFLLGRLDRADQPTAAVFDLGGGSTQIVFEPKAGDLIAEGDQKYRLTHDGVEHVLYQHSYLGYGLMEARKRMHRLVIELAEHPSMIHSPCLPRDLQWEFSHEDEEVSFVGQGSYQDCVRAVDEILNKNAVCLAPPCAFDGIHQPTISYSFNGPIYIFSYFHDRTQPLGLPSHFQLPELEDLTNRVCSGEYLESVQDPELRAEMLDRPEWCLDLAYMYRLLSYGYDIPEDRVIHIAKKIDGVETGWCLGASIALLDGLSTMT